MSSHALLDITKMSLVSGNASSVQVASIVMCLFSQLCIHKISHVHEDTTVHWEPIMQLNILAQLAISMI
jgi:hypothetical protein